MTAPAPPYYSAVADKNSGQFTDPWKRWLGSFYTYVNALSTSGTSTGGGSGTVTNTLGPLNANFVMLGNGGNDSTTLGSTGQTTTVLHGNVFGAPYWANVNLASDVAGVLPVANGGNGVASPAIVAGQNIAVSGSWPGQTVSWASPATSAGDLITAVSTATGTSTVVVPARIAIGTNGQVMTVVAGAPSWASGLTNPMNTLGDIITGGTGGTPQRLGVGTNGQVLSVVSGVPAWAATSGGGGSGAQGPTFRAHATAGTALTGGTAGKINFAVTDFDNTSGYSSSRFTPKVAGYYTVTGSVTHAYAATIFAALLYKNGVAVAQGVYTGLSAGNGSSTVVDTVYLNGSTDYVEIWVYSDVGGTSYGSVTTDYFSASYSSVAPSTAQGPAFRAHATVGTTLSGGVGGKITFGVVDFDNTSSYSSSRFQPNIAGYYTVSGSVTHAYSANTFSTQIYKNGSVYSQGAYTSVSSGGGSSTVSDAVYFNGSSDYVEIWAYSDVGGTTYGAAGTDYFSALYAGPTSGGSSSGPVTSVFQASNSTVTGGAYTKVVNMTSVEFDANTCWDTTNNWFKPSVAGYYQINSQVEFAGAFGLINLYKNGSAYKNGSFAAGAGGVNGGSMASSIVHFNGTTDYMEIYCYLGSTGGNTIAGASSTYFNAAWLRS